VFSQDYKGWVVWLDDGSYLCEASVQSPKLLSVSGGGKEIPHRGYGRQCVELR
jgi:hypothetical protein